MLLWVLSWVLKAPFWKKVCGVLGMVLFLAFTSPLILHFVLRATEYPPVSKDALPFSEVAIVLGGANKTNMGVPDQLHFNESADRVTEGLTLYHSGMVKKLLLSGGSGELIHDDEKESTQVYQFLLTTGVKKPHLLIDSLSRNTHENAVESKKLLRKHGISDRPVILITSATHMHRAIRCFRKQGLEVIPYPVDYQAGKLLWSPSLFVPTVEGFTVWYKLLHEWLGTIAYQIVGYV